MYICIIIFYILYGGLKKTLMYKEYSIIIMTKYMYKLAVQKCKLQNYGCKNNYKNAKLDTVQK